MENENVKVNDQEQLVPQEKQKPEENPVKEQEPKQNLLGKIKAKAETAKENRKQWCEKHPKIVKGVKIVGTGITVAAGVVGGLFLANEMAKRSEGSSEGVEEESIPWEGEDLDETETTEESTEEYPTEE